MKGVAALTWFQSSHWRIVSGVLALAGWHGALRQCVVLPALRTIGMGGAAQRQEPTKLPACGQDLF